MSPSIDRPFEQLARVPSARAGAAVVVAIVVGRLASSLAAALSGVAGRDAGTEAMAMLAPTVSQLPTPTATPGAPRSVPIRQVAVTPTPIPAPPSAVDANELGRIPIFMYHVFVYDAANTDEWTVTFDQFCAQLNKLVNRMYRKETRVIVEKSGIPVAGIVSADDIERLRRMEEEDRQAWFIIDEMREAFRDVPPGKSSGKRIAFSRSCVKKTAVSAKPLLVYVEAVLRELLAAYQHSG